MDAIDKARELGAQHGREAGEAWWYAEDCAATKTTALAVMLALAHGHGVRLGLPGPDLSVLHARESEFVLVNRELQDAYCDAFRQARDETIRKAVGA